MKTHDTKPIFASTQQVLDMQRLAGKVFTKMPKSMANRILRSTDSQKTFMRELSKMCKLPVIETIAETSHLKLLSGGKALTVSACKGGENASLAYATKTFTGYIDDCFKSWNLANSQIATPETEAQVWEMAKDANFNDIFTSFKTDLYNLAWNSQEQIEMFCNEHKDELRKEGYGTFFLFKEKVNNKEEFFVTYVGFADAGRLGVNVFGLSYAYVWAAEYRHRVVVPATWNLVA